MGKKRGGNKQQQQQNNKPAAVEAVAPRVEDDQVAVVAEETSPAVAVPITIDAVPITKQPADLPEDTNTTTEKNDNSEVIAAEQQQEGTTTTPRGTSGDEELTPGGESPQGKKNAVAANVVSEEAVEEEEQEQEAKEEQKETCLESPTSTVEEKPLVPSDAATTSTVTPAAEDDESSPASSTSPAKRCNGTTASTSNRNKLINERIDQFFALPIVEFVGLIVIKLAVTVVVFALKLRNKVLQSEITDRVQKTTLFTTATNLVDPKKVQKLSVDGLDLLDSKVVVPLQLMDEDTPQGKLFKGASLIVFEIIDDAQKQLTKKKDE